MAVSRMKPLDDLEKNLDTLLKELQKSRKDRKKSEGQLKEMEAECNGQAKEIERLRRKAGDVSGKLDLQYRRKREEIQSRLTNVLARLESL